MLLKSVMHEEMPEVVRFDESGKEVAAGTVCGGCACPELGETGEGPLGAKT